MIFVALPKDCTMRTLHSSLPAMLHTEARVWPVRAVLSNADLLRRIPAR